MHIIKTDRVTPFCFRSMMRHILKDHLFECSATLSYYFLFSVFPLALLISVFFSTLNINAEEFREVSGFIPYDILNVLENYQKEVATESNGTLIIVGIFLTLYSMGKAIQTMKRKFRLAYGAKERKQTLFDRIISTTFVFLVLISFYAMLILIVAGNYFFSFLIENFPILKSALPSFRIIRLLAVTAYLFFVLWGLYFVLPGIKQKIRFALPGTIFALLSWVLMSYAFSVYLDYFSNLKSIYGSLSTIIALLLWLFLINMILLIGARINSYFYLLGKGASYG